MAEELKHMFSEAYFRQLAGEMRRAWKPFPTERFLAAVMAGLEPMGLNDRMRHAVACLQAVLPPAPERALEILKEAVPAMPYGYQNLLFPDWVAKYLRDKPSLALPALHYFTRFGSSEFAIRHFLLDDFEGTIRVMEQWATDENEHVRRLASEGSRPRLPWSFRLDHVLRNPLATARILEALRNDPALYVRKSVANHLNDISKDHPGHVIATLKGWELHEPGPAWIAKHACRSLIKAGHADALALFAVSSDVVVEVNAFSQNQQELSLGETFEFRFELRNAMDSRQKFVVDYAITYPKQRGSYRKVFKLKEVELEAGEKVSIVKRQVIKDFSTRIHYAGRHELEVLVNGKTVYSAHFDLAV